MFDLTDSLIRATVSGPAYAAGQAYMRAGRVRELRLDPARKLIVAAVQGSSKAPYRQTITLQTSKTACP
jgi:uncharacterized Zn finger protein